MSFVPSLRILALLPVMAMALDDLPLYLDVGCAGDATTGGLNNGFAQGPSDMVLADKASGGKTVPVTCAEKLSGTDAIVVNLPRKLANGEYWDFGIKFADDRAHGLKSFKDVHLWIRNRASTVAKFRIGWEESAGASGKMKDVEIPGGGDWKEYVYTMEEIPGDSVYGLKLSHPLGQYNGPDTEADPIDILIDSIVVTDGTGKGAIAVPTRLHPQVPANWGANFLLGSFDNREVGKSTVAAQAGLPYRYQYMMPETQKYYTSSGKGYLYDYAMESEKLGVKTAIVWYNLGKVGEGWGPVTKNLADAAYMTEYFDRFEWVLDQLEMAGQSDYMLVCEPDMYGFLMRGPGGATGTPVTDPTLIAVDMSRANVLSGKTYPANLAGWAEYLVTRARQKLTNGVIVGHMPNHWGVSIPGQVGQGRKESHYISALAIGTFLEGLGPIGRGDVVFVEKSDHDAGHKPAQEDWLWDSANYAKYFLWTRTISWKTGLPICGWQVSEGNMSNVPTWKDDAAETYLAHPDWWIDGAFAGILFGAGNADCVNYGDDDDDGWFVDHMTLASKTPVPLPLATGVRGAGAARTELRCLCRSGGLELSGWKGLAEATFIDLKGRVLARSRIRSGQFLSWPSGANGTYIVHVSNDAGIAYSRLVTVP
ncbi:MAG: hypothetical protein H6686_05995 [Fibrobacteria bacterium]|nr:hypothetical protein [Fibrobacteria bacterium]